jgi:Fe(3+) dicitrate transport protein
LIELI